MEKTSLSDFRTGADDPLFGDNHLTLIRWIFASMVALSHCWHLANGTDPLRIYTFSIGDLALNGFFIVSGLLISKSLHASLNLRRYAISRILRVYPALCVVLLSLPLLFSPAFSHPGGLQNFIAAENWAYVLRVLTLGATDNAPNGIFAGNVYADFNTPLWTIRIEIFAYIGAAALFYSGLARTQVRILFLALAITLFYIAAFNLSDISLHASLKDLTRLASCFALGMLMFYTPVLRKLDWRHAASGALLFLIFGDSIFDELSANICMATFIIAFGLPTKVNTAIVKMPDYSYGIYIWHCPLMQALLFVEPDLGPLQILALGMPLTLGVAALSWIIIEKPALALKPILADIRLIKTSRVSEKAHTPGP